MSPLKKKFASWITVPWHPVLLTVYPILALLGHNIGEVEIDAAYRSLIVGIILTILVLVLLSLLLHNWRKAAVVLAMMVVLFFFYGHLYNYLHDIGPVMLIRHRYLFPLLFVLIGLLVWRTIKSKADFIETTTWLNIFSILMLVFPIYQIVGYEIQRGNEIKNAPVETIVGSANSVPGNMPDVYYIILDAYGRSDILQKEFGFDNTEFLNDLKSRGFYVADCAQSNYAKTAISLGSSLNINYLQGLTTEGLTFETRFSPAWALIRNNAVMEEFKRLGYKTVAFETGYSWTEFKDSTVYLAPSGGVAVGFETLLIRTSALLILDDAGWLERFHYTPEAQKHDLVLFVLDQLGDTVPQIQGPKFVFVHLVIPHQPFVMGPNGELSVVAPRTLNNEESYRRDDYVLGYTNQTAFISKEFPRVLDAIINQSSTPPVIIIQGDHGPASNDPEVRMSILNAYYFPNADPAVYPKITPVNTFRVIFNTYFNAGLPILEDHSYFSQNDNVYEFQDVPNHCVSPQ